MNGSVTISARQGVRVALRLFWDSVRAWWNNDMVTFYFWSDR